MNYFKKAYDIRIILLIKGICVNILQSDISYNMKRKKLYKKVRDVLLFTVFNLLFINREVNDTSEDLSKRIVSINKRITREGIEHYLILENDSSGVERFINLKEYNQLLDRQAQNNSTLFLHFYTD